jgi:hypothetical protein
MKLLAVFLLDLAVVAVALFVYDRSREEPAPSNAPAFNVRAELAALEARIDALETAPPPRLPDPADDPRILERLTALEQASGAPVPEAAGGAEAETVPDPLGPDSVRAFRRLREKVRREESAERNRVWINGALDKLRLNLTDTQRSRIVAAWVTFEPRRDEIWTEAKLRAQETIAAGGRIDRAEFVDETVDVIRSEFATTLAGVLHPADAEAVAGALNPRGK